MSKFPNIGNFGIHGGPEMKQLRERVNNIMILFADCYNDKERHKDIDGLMKKAMNIINHYRTENNETVQDRVKEYLEIKCGRGTKCYNINKIKFFRDIPDGIEILIDYVDVTAIRTMNIPTEIVYESIYRHLPELFEE